MVFDLKSEALLAYYSTQIQPFYPRFITIAYPIDIIESQSRSFSIWNSRQVLAE